MFSHTLIGLWAKSIKPTPIPPEPPKHWGFSVLGTKRTYTDTTALPWLRQWWRGEAEDGPIGTYAPSTIKVKIKRNLPHDRVVLYHTGELYAKTKLLYRRGTFILQVGVPYAKHLEKRYGKRIWGLSPTARQEFLEIYVDTLIRHYKRIKHG